MGRDGDAGPRPDDVEGQDLTDTAPQPAVGRTPEPPAAPTRHSTLVAVAGATAAVLVLTAVGVLALSRAAGSPTASASTASGSAGVAAGLTPAASSAPDATNTDAAPMLPASQPTLVLGDSLGLDVYPWLADALSDRYVSYAAEVGRSTPGTAKALAALPTVPPVVIVSSGTNDGAAAVVEQSARQILDQLGPRRCVVWVDVVRPATFGDTQEAVNAAIGRATAGRPNVRILRWSEMVAAHPEWMGRDGIHPDDTGARARAQAMAAAAAACSPIDPSAPRAPRQVLPASIFRGPISTQYRSPGSSAQPSRSSSPTTSTARPTASGQGGTASASPSTTPTSATPTASSGSSSPASTPSATTSSDAPAAATSPPT
jgi:hypothetical protein